jgi:hypothetical protein
MRRRVANEPVTQPSPGTVLIRFVLTGVLGTLLNITSPPSPHRTFSAQRTAGTMASPSASAKAAFTSAK